MTAAREFLTQDSQGRDMLVAITVVGADAGVVWQALRQARSFVIEREHEEHRYKGRFVRGWSEEDGFFYAESPDEDPGSLHRDGATDGCGSGRLPTSQVARRDFG